MKQVFQVLAMFALVFAVACTKSSDSDVTPSSTVNVLTPANELLTLGQGASGTVAGPFGGDTSRRRCDSLGRGHHGRHPGGGKGDSIAFSALPAAAQTYLITNADTSKIIRIEKITLSDSTVRYGVRLSDHTHYHFDATGAVIVDEPRGDKFVEVLVTDLPATAQSYLTTNGHTTDIAQIVKVTKTDGSVFYGVRLTTNTLITFDSTGAVIPNPTRPRRGRH